MSAGERRETGEAEKDENKHKRREQEDRKTRIVITRKKDQQKLKKVQIAVCLLKKWPYSQQMDMIFNRKGMFSGCKHMIPVKLKGCWNCHDNIVTSHFISYVLYTF